MVPSGGVGPGVFGVGWATPAGEMRHLCHLWAGVFLRGGRGESFYSAASSTRCGAAAPALAKLISSVTGPSSSSRRSYL